MAVPSFEPTRTKYYGLRDDASEGTLTGAFTEADRGAWWYNTDRKLFCFWDGQYIHRWGRTEGHFYTANQTFVIPVGGGCVGGSITVTSVTTIMFVLSLTVIGTNPAVCDVYTPQRVSFGGNVIGVTMGGATGTTVTVQALVSGYPPV